MAVWRAPGLYKLGVHAKWQGVDLVCTREHYTGDAAEHPWDPGDGWPPEKAATLWAPNGPIEAEKLRGLISVGSSTVQGEPTRFLAVLNLAAGA